MTDWSHFKHWLNAARSLRSRPRPDTTPSPPSAAGPRQPPPDEEMPPGFTPEMLRRLEDQLLFVIGCARSGTTALTRALNRSPELLLLEEPNFFSNRPIRNFAEFFNRMHREMGTPRMKGAYVPASVEPEIGPLPMLARLAHDYRYVGGKVAFGPHVYTVEWPDGFIDYHAKYFFHARRLLIARRPAESIWSMHKLFADRPLPALFGAWLRSAAACIDCYRVFPDVNWMFFDDLTPESIVKFAATLSVPLEIPPGMLARSYVKSRLGPGELPPLLAPYASWCATCAEIYELLYENFCRDRLRYCGSRSEWDFFDDMRGRVWELLDEVEGRKKAAG